MEENDLNKVIKGTTTEADDEFMAQIADALQARKPMSAAERERYDSINKAREEELKLQGDALKLEKINMKNDLKIHKILISLISFCVGILIARFIGS